MTSWDWLDQAACKGMDTEMFFTADTSAGEGQDVMRARDALRVCQRCPVKTPCEQYRRATNSQFGIWAGRVHTYSGKGRTPAPFDPTNCGTVKNANAHRRHGQKPCEPCLAAERKAAEEKRKRRVVVAEKRCPDCGVVKPAKAFHLGNSADGLYAYCKVCKNIRNQAQRRRTA